MQVRRFKTLDAGRRVQGFLDTHAAAVGNAVPPELRAELDAAVSQFTTYVQEQETNTAAARGETANQSVLRADVYERFIKPIGKIAKRKLSKKPEILELVVPARGLRDSSFVSKATAAADAAAKYVDTFMTNGLGADFAPRMKAAIAAITASSDLRARQLSRKFAATAGIDTADKVVKQLIDQIDAVITPVLRGNSDALSDWAASKRIHQVAVNPIPTGSLTLPTSDAEPTTPTLVPSEPQTAKAAA